MHCIVNIFFFYFADRSGEFTQSLQAIIVSCRGNYAEFRFHELFSLFFLFSRLLICNKKLLSELFLIKFFLKKQYNCINAIFKGVKIAFFDKNSHIFLA